MLILSVSEIVLVEIGTPISDDIFNAGGRSRVMVCRFFFEEKLNLKPDTCSKT
jgi:hypothetical protein